MTAERRYAEGGYVAFDGARDSIPIRIHPGESWFTRETVEKYGRPFLEKLTGGKVHTFDDGEPS